jgi:hypothetical protein
MKNVYDMTTDELYAELAEMYENAPSMGKMRSSREPQVNNRMSTLKRHEDKLNRYRNDGVLR